MGPRFRGDDSAKRVGNAALLPTLQTEGLRTLSDDQAALAFDIASTA
jgi:hypothetical protein